MTARGARPTAPWPGDILIALGVVVALLPVYQLWWTNVQAANAAASMRDRYSRRERGWLSPVAWARMTRTPG